MKRDTSGIMNRSPLSHPWCGWAQQWMEGWRWGGRLWMMDMSLSLSFSLSTHHASLSLCSVSRVPEWKYSQCKLKPFNGQGLSASSALWPSAARALAQEESLRYTGAISLTLQWCSEKLQRKGQETKKNTTLQRARDRNEMLQLYKARWKKKKRTRGMGSMKRRCNKREWVIRANHTFRGSGREKRGEDLGLKQEATMWEGAGVETV